MLAIVHCIAEEDVELPWLLKHADSALNADLTFTCEIDSEEDLTKPILMVRARGPSSHRIWLQVDQPV